MRLYKLCSNELYHVYEGNDVVLEAEYSLASYHDGKTRLDREIVYLNSGRFNLTISTNKGEEPVLSCSSAREQLEEKVLSAIELLPGHVKQPIKRALGKKE